MDAHREGAAHVPGTRSAAACVRLLNAYVTDAVLGYAPGALPYAMPLTGGPVPGYLQAEKRLRRCSCSPSEERSR